MNLRDLDAKMNGRLLIQFSGLMRSGGGWLVEAWVLSNTTPMIDAYSLIIGICSFRAAIAAGSAMEYFEIIFQYQQQVLDSQSSQYFGPAVEHLATCQVDATCSLSLQSNIPAHPSPRISGNWTRHRFVVTDMILLEYLADDLLLPHSYDLASVNKLHNRTCSTELIGNQKWFIFRLKSSISSAWPNPW